MKQSTFSAVMANSIKNLLQGYTKGIRFVAVLTMLLTMGIGQAWGAEGDLVYTLSFSKLTTGTNFNSYTAAHTITVSSKNWSVVGNQSLGAYLCIGGKNTSNTNRTLYSTSQISSDKVVGKITISNGGTGGTGTITLNSIKLEVASNSTFATIIDTKTINSPAKDGSIDFTPTAPLAVWPKNSYYRITYNYKNNQSNSNGYIKVNNIKFYEGSDPDTNFKVGATLFIQALSSSAWDASACVKAWFNGNNTAATTYWLYDATGSDAGKKMFATIVPTGTSSQVQIQRFASNCNDWWNSNGDLKKSDGANTNILQTNGSGTNNVAWNAGGLQLYLYGTPDSWANSLATFSDQGEGIWTATYSNYSPTATSADFKIKDSYNGWIGNTGSNNNATLSGMVVGSTYDISATLNIPNHTLEIDKTLKACKVHFDMNGHGADIASKTNVTPNSTITAPTEPTDADYKFEGWYKESSCTNQWNFDTDKVTETMTLYAKWTKKVSYTITWKVNNNDHFVGTPTTSIYEGSTYQDLTLPTDPEDSALDACYPQKVFVGWSTHDLGYAETTEPDDLFTSDNVPDTEITANTTFYAVFASKETISGGGAPEWLETDLANITASDVVVITMTYTTDGTVYALSSANGSSSAPTATIVTVSNGALSTEPTDALKWNISNNSGTLTIYPNGTTETWLYCTDTNNGVRVGTNANKAFTIDATSGYLNNTATSRYVGVFRTNPDWRCYTSSTTNIGDQTLAFYKKKETSSTETTGYVTECCTLNNITLDGSGTTTGGTFSATATKACKGEDITLTATAADCYEFVSWTIKKTSDDTDVTNSVLDGNTLTMPDYAVTVYATFKSLSVTEIALSMTDGHKNLDVGETNQLLVTYTPADATCDKAIVSWTSSDDNVISVTNSGLVTALRSGNATITATTAAGISNTYTIVVNNPACEAWFIHYWNASTGGDECFYKVKPDDPNDHEWRTNNFSLPSNSDEDGFVVNNAKGEDPYKTDQIFRTGIGFADIQRGGQNCGTNPYPGQDAYGQLSIYDDSNTPNRYIAFYPAQYMVTFGKEGSSGWVEMPLTNTNGYEYESEPFMVPNGYKADNSYKYWVGITKQDGSMLYVDGKSSVDAMNTVNGLSTSDMAGKWGVWHIWSNSCANNWYAEFIRYYRVDFNLAGGEGDIAPRYGKAAEPYAKFSTSDITAPTRDGYTFLGWKDQNNKIYAPTDATVTINNDLTLTALWVEEYGSDNCRWEEVSIDDIVYGDEVVIATYKNGYTYALKDNDGGASTAPKAVLLTINSNKTINTEETPISNSLIWNIDYDKEDTKNLVIYSTRNAGKWLYSNAANDGVRIGTNANKEFKIVEGTGDDAGNFFLYHIAQKRYLGVYYTNLEWRGYTTINTYITGQTLKFYKRICLPEGQYRVTWDANGGAWSDGSTTKEEIYTEGAAINLPEEPELDGYKFDGWEPAPTTMPAENTTFTAKWAKLHTITWMVGGSELTTGSQTTSVENGKKITAIPANPNDNTLEDCGATKFMGWSTQSSGSTPEDVDYYNDLFTTVAESPEITKPTTFYAVFATASSGGGENTTEVFATTDIVSSTGVTSGYTISADAEKALGYYQDGSFDDKRYVQVMKSDVSTPMIANIPISITVTAKLGGGSAKDPLTNSVYAIWLDAEGNEFGDAVLLTNKITAKTGSNFTANLPIANATSAYGVRVYHQKESGYNVRYYAISLSYKYNDVTYSNYVTQCCTDWTPTLTYSKTTLDSETNETATPTITGNTHNAQVSFESSNESVLTVDANNGTITAVGAGKATITATWAKTDDYCGKSITTDEITVNGKFLVTFHANDGSGNTTTQQIPSNTATALNANTFQRDGYTFQGWATSASGAKVYDDGQEVTLSKSGLDLYAVWQVKAYNITTGTITGEGTITTSPANSANCDAQVTITATPAAHYTLASVTVTRDDNSQTVDVVGNKFTMPASDVTITAVFTENEKFAINYAIPTGGGTLTDNAPTTIYIDGSITLPGIKDGTISSEYSCEQFIGWTTLNSYESYECAMPTPFYKAGDELSDITEATTLRPVYKRNGAGEGGTITIGEEDMKSWNPNSLSSIAYGQPRSFTKGNFTWETTAMQQSSWGGEVQLDKNEEYYIKLPDLPGDLQSVTLDCRNGGSNTLTDGTFYLKDKNNVVIKQSSVSPNNVCTFTDIPAGNSTAYLYAGVVSRILGITVTYGSPSIISTNLSCDYNVDEFTITYHTNFGTDVGQIPTGTVVNGACDNSGEPIRFEDLPDGEYTICNSLTATQYKLVGWNNQPDGNGGLTYRPGDVITTVSQSVITLYAQWVPEVIMLDNTDRTITYQETIGEAITLPVGAYTCDGKYTFVGWTTDNVDSWNQKITKPTLVAELDGNDETLFVPDGPTVVYAVYKLETTANSKAFYLKSGNNFYAQKHNTYVLKGTSNIADATRLYRQQINVESPNNYWLYYLDDEQQKRFVYINTASLGSLFIPSIGDGETTPEDTEGWEFVSVTGGYKLKALGNYGSTQYMRTADSGNMGSNTTGSVYTIETATEINYYAYPTCSDEITITFETRGGTLNPNDHPYVLTKKEGDVITLPGCEYAGLDFIGWVNEPIEPTEIIANPEDIYEAEEEYVVGNQNIVLYAYYSQTPESAEYDGNSDGEWKIYAFADGEYHFAVAPDSEEGEMSTVTICDKSTTWTFTNVAENQYHIQDEAGRYVGVRPAIENKNDFRFTDEPVIWTIESKGNDLYRLTCETNTDRVMLYDNGSIRYSSHTQEGNPEYFYVTIGGCFNPIYTTDPARLQAVSVYGTVQITSTLGQTVKAMDKLTLVVRHAEPESYIRFSSPNVTFYDESGNVITTALVESQKQQIPLVVAYTPNVADNSIARPAITVTAKTLNPSTGTYVETNYSVNGRISARSLPADFAIVAKVGNMWYALPSQGLNSTTPPAAYPVEVDNMADPTAVVSVPANADWSLRQVYASSGSNDRFTANGDNLVFVNNASPAMALNASTSGNYLLTDAQYANYYQTNPGLYEWTPTTTDLETYQLTNEQRSITLSVNTATVFGVHATDKAVEQVRFLPIQNRYTPAALQVVEWKENSVVIMYNGDPAQTASVSVNGVAPQETVLSSAQRDIAVYELAATGLAANPTQRLSITIGTEKVILPIPYIISGSKTDYDLLPGSSVSAKREAAKVSDLVILEEATLTAAGTNKNDPYKFRHVTIYGGGKLVIPENNSFGVASLTLRAGGITNAGEYDYVYPQFELRGTFTNSTSGFYYDYITDYDHWYHLVLPFAADITTIKYPTEFYGANVTAGNKGSWVIKRYAGEIRATGNYNAWVDIETEGKTSTTAGQGYIFWGAPKKVTVNGKTDRQKWGIQRITMPITAGNAIDAENDKEGGKTISGLGSYENIANNSGKPNDQGWNLIGNPYMVNLTNMSTSGLHACKLVEVIDPATGKWNGKWDWNDETNIRYLTIPSEHFDTYTAKTVTQAVPLVPGRAFFVQLEGEANGVTFSAANRASLMPQHLAAQNTAVEVETGIVLSSETMQDEVNFWIKDGKTNDYEYNADYPKTPNNTNFNIYGVHAHGDLSWVATGPEYAAESMPIGYQVPAAGTYTLSVSDTYYSDLLEALYVTDHALSPELTTDLMSNPYEFTVNQAETNNTRFTVRVKLKDKNSGTTTGVDNTTTLDSDKPIKFIYNDKIYILYRSTIYDAAGKRVTTINK